MGSQRPSVSVRPAGPPASPNPEARNRELRLTDDVRYLPGVGPARAVALLRLGVRTVRDLLELYPFRYERIPPPQPIESLDERLEESATVVGRLRHIDEFHYNGESGVSADVVDATGRCSVRWFHSAFLLERLKEGMYIRLSGRVREFYNAPSFSNPRWQAVQGGYPGKRSHSEADDEYVPVYSTTAPLSSEMIARLLDRVLDEAVRQIIDFVPPAVTSSRGLPPRREAIQRIHRPASLEQAEQARRRLAFDELLLVRLALECSRQRRVEGVAPRIVVDQAIDQRIRKRFPFALTAGQDRAIAEIRRDLSRTHPMNRLLQAEVGAGKTAVAVYAALAAVANRRQVALIAPTEVLADQHRAKIAQYLEGSRVRTGYLSGATKRPERAKLLKNLADGEIDLIIGTHALLEEDVRFHDLGLVIVDEQQRFGVMQRAALRAKGGAPHVLVLSATPIPRTLALTIFGDLDMSMIQGMPPGRRPVTTRVVPPKLSADAWAFASSRLARGEQGYIVFPLIDEAEGSSLQAATTEFEALAAGVMKGHRLGLLHGRMPPNEKRKVIGRFASGDIQMLVATTVIEVGIDVPAATVMIIQHAERYGLSQLHQLRGRVGRGNKPSWCLLFTHETAAETNERLGVLCRVNDGFKIAEEDLRLRGPGEFLGTRQHGVPSFKAANLITDADLIEEARTAAAKIISSDPALSRSEHAALKRELFERYGAMMHLARTG